MTAEQDPPSSTDEPLTKLRPSLQPHLRLFLSADIVGSTAFKQRGGTQPSGTWFAVVAHFYQLTEAALIRHWQVGHRILLKGGQTDSLYGEPPALWKTIGDEVAFTKKLTHPAQAVTTLHAWVAALGEVRVLLQKHGLDVKASAWLADFPHRNYEVVLRVGNPQNELQDGAGEDYFQWANDRLLQEYLDPSKNAGLIRDFVGPAIDTGFRLGANASPRKFMISVELAYLLSGEEIRGGDSIYNLGSFKLKPFVFRYDGRQPLKGVLSGAPYPLIWIDVLPNDALNVAEDDLDNIVAATPLKVRKFAEAYIAAHPERLCSVYMHSDLERPEEYSIIPGSVVARLLERQESYLAKDRALEAESRQNEELDEGPTKKVGQPAVNEDFSTAILRSIEFIRAAQAAASKSK